MKIGEVIKANRGIEKANNSKPRSGFVKAWRKPTLRRLEKNCPNSIVLLKGLNFNSITSAHINTREKDLIASDAPKIHEITYMYGEDTVRNLIGAYISNFQSLLNIKDENKLNPMQLSAVVDIVIMRCSGLTVVELAMMFKRFLSGEFGKFYGQIDIMEIGNWVKSFMRKRGEIICSDHEIRAYLLKRDQNYIEK